MSDFVLMSHIDWEIPENSVWGVGGCGFIARLKDVDNHLVIFLSPKGNAELGAMTTSGFNYQGYHWQNPDLPNYSNIQPALSGSADIVLVVEVVRRFDLSGRYRLYDCLWHKQGLWN